MATQTMARTTAKKVADFLVHFGIEHGDPLTNLKLQKLLYYSQAWFLALKDEPLFDEPFEAWVHGPVIRSIYSEYKKYGYAPIVEDPGDEITKELSSDVVEHLLEVMETFGHYTAWQLERMTHLEKPWLIARNGIASDESCDAKISEDEMRNFYRSLMVEQPA